MSFKDFIKTTDLTGSDLNVLGIALSLLLSFAIGMFIFWIYKRTYQGVMYSKTFNISLIGLSMITASIILAVTSNVILSLGMVGALSIVRFRTAIKDPMDVIYMFWAISAGIISGAGLYLLAIVTSTIIGIVLYTFSKVSTKNEPYLLIANYDNSSLENEFFKAVNDYVSLYKIKSKIKTIDGFEITIEVRSKKDVTKLINNIDEINGITNVALMSYDGEFAA